MVQVPMIEGQRSTNPLNTDSSVVAFISPQPPSAAPPPPDFSPLFGSASLFIPEVCTSQMGRGAGQKLRKE